MTGPSRAQFTRLIAQHKRTGHIRDRRGKPPANPFQRRYTPGDAALPAEVDVAYGRFSGPATKEALRRQYEEMSGVRPSFRSRLVRRHLGPLNAFFSALQPARPPAATSPARPFSYSIVPTAWAVARRGGESWRSGRTEVEMGLTKRKLATDRVQPKSTRLTISRRQHVGYPTRPDDMTY